MHALGLHATMGTKGQRHTGWRIVRVVCCGGNLGQCRTNLTILCPRIPHVGHRSDDQQHGTESNGGLDRS